MKITRLSKEIMTRIYSNYVDDNMELSESDLCNHFVKKYGNGYYKASLNYLKDLGYIDLVWLLGRYQNGHQKYIIRKVLPRGIYWIESNGEDTGRK